MIAKVSIINPNISGEVSTQEQQELNYELLLTTIYKGQDGKSAYQIALEHGFVGTEEEWIASNKLVYKIVTELPTIGDSSIFYLIKKGDSYEQYAYNNGEYVLVGDTNVNLDDYYTKAETFSKSETNTKLSEKVDKINGKQLSTNDYTTEEKNKLANIKEFAEKNVQPNWEETDQTSDSYIRNKPVLFSGDYNDLLNKPDLNAEISEEQLPIASESKKGIVQLATKEEVKNGTESSKAISPSTLKTIIDTLTAKEIVGTDSTTYAFDVSSLSTIDEIKEKYQGIDSITNVIVAKDGLLVQVNNDNYFRIRIENDRVRIVGIVDLEIIDDSLQTTDKTLIGAINEIFKKLLVGGDVITTKIYSLRNTADETHKVYSLEDPTFQNAGFTLYSDKDCSIEYGKIVSNMSGTIKIDADKNITWALGGSEEYVSSKRVATEYAVYNAIKNNTSASATEWNASSDLNNYTQTGLYHFQGFRTNENDNLPIDNVGEFVNIAFTLIVDKVEGKYDTTAGINLPEHVSQTLFLGNRQGSETKIYVRNATTFLGDGTTTWESWKELVTSTYLGIASSMEDELLNDATEIGLYTGAIVNTSTNTFDVFKLEVINNYAISNQASQLTGSIIPNTVLQTMTIVSLDSTDKQYKRKGNSINGVYQWEDWKEAGTTTKFKTGDVVYRTNVPNFHFGVMTWEEFEANPTNSMDTKVPIGLVVDPVKRTFVFCQLLPQGFAQIGSVSFWGGYTSFDDGAETFKRLEGLQNNAQCAAYWALRKESYGNDSVFYSKNDTAYVPALNEWNKAYEPIFYGNINIDGQMLSLMDKFICLKEGEEIFYGNKYFTYDYLPTKFYSHLSTLCFIDDFEGDTSKNTFVFGAHGAPINYGRAGYCPVFGIYTEEEENA